MHRHFFLKAVVASKVNLLVATQLEKFSRWNCSLLSAQAVFPATKYYLNTQEGLVSKLLLPVFSVSNSRWNPTTFLNSKIKANYTFISHFLKFLLNYKYLQFLSIDYHPFRLQYLQTFTKSTFAYLSLTQRVSTHAIKATT